MSDFLRERLFLVWVLLIAVTLLSSMIGGAHGFVSTGHGAEATFAVLAIAFGKIWLVMLHFMDVRGAPPALKIICALWSLIVLSILLAVYMRILPF